MPDPWDSKNAKDRAACETACHNLVLTIKAAGQTGVNWQGVQEVRQRAHEHASDFWNPLLQALLRYEGMNEDDFEEKLSAFIQQAAPDIPKYFVKHALG